MQTTNHKAFWGDLLLSGGKFLSPGVLVVDENGKIVEVVDKIPDHIPPSRQFRFKNRVLLPGGVNSHSHGFQILIRGQADQALNFSDWVDNYLYRLVLWADDDQLYAGALLAFGEMIQNGVTSVGEFYYIHNEKSSFAPGKNRLAEIAIQAAQDVGLRICLLRTIYDCQKKEGQKRFCEPLEKAVENTEALHEKYRDHPLVSVLPAPHSLHGASEKAIQAGAELAKKWGVKFHIHLAEEPHDLPFCQGLYGTTPLRALEKMGVLGPNLVIVHGCHLDSDEIGMLGRAGGGLAYNPLSNMALGDGISDIEGYLKAGATISLGTDGACANNQVNLFGEMRGTEHLQRVSKLRMGVIPQQAKGECSNYLFEMATANGGKNLSLPIGKLEPGYLADFIALDLDDLSLLPDFERDGPVLLNNIIYSLSMRSALTDSVIGGKFVLRNRELVRFSQGEIARTVRSAMREWERA